VSTCVSAYGVDADALHVPLTAALYPPTPVQMYSLTSKDDSTWASMVLAEMGTEVGLGG
jgi:hypothetical protein